MFNLLRSDLYRTVRTPTFWVFLGVIVAMMFLVAGMLNWVASPEFSDMVNDSATAQGQPLSPEDQAELEEGLDEASAISKSLDSLTHLWAQTFLTGGFLGILGSAFIAVFLVSDFKSGFVKNLPMDRRGRRTYYLEKVAYILLIQAIFLLACALFNTIAFAAFGFTFETEEPITNVILWLGLAWLTQCAYALIVACLVWAVRSDWMGVSAALIISTGMLGSFIVQLLLLLSKGLPFLAAIPSWLLVSATQLLGGGGASLLMPDANLPFAGMLPAGYIALVGAIYAGASIAITMAVLRRRDIQ